jgi:DNA-binding Lrp family transcriptional regulator
MPNALDEVDKEILHLLQNDGRANNRDIADEIGLSPGTASRRINKLERDGIIKGYYPDIDYDATGYPLRVLFVCSVPITDRRSLIQRALDIPGVVNLLELMTGTTNVHIEVIGQENADISELAFTISHLGITICG